MLGKWYQDAEESALKRWSDDDAYDRDASAGHQALYWALLVASRCIMVAVLLGAERIAKAIEAGNVVTVEAT